MKKILALMGAVLLLSVSARAVEVSAPSAVLMEKETGTVLFAKNEHEKLEPASVTKIMTLLLTRLLTAGHCAMRTPLPLHLTPAPWAAVRFG